MTDKLDNKKIEKNIPIPQYNGKHADLIQKMEVGDSVLCEDLRNAKSLYQVMKRKGWKSALRKVCDQGYGLYRVWRIK